MMKLFHIDLAPVKPCVKVGDITSGAKPDTGDFKIEEATKETAGAATDPTTNAQKTEGEAFRADESVETPSSTPKKKDSWPTNDPEQANSTLFDNPTTIATTQPGMFTPLLKVGDKIVNLECEKRQLKDLVKAMIEMDENRTKQVHDFLAQFNEKEEHRKKQLLILLSQVSDDLM